jgi:hypothetical protein
LFYADGGTDRQDKANGRFSQVCEGNKICQFVHILELFKTEEPRSCASETSQLTGSFMFNSENI